MVTFADTTALRLGRALRAMRERLGTSAPPTPELHEELAEHFDVTTEESRAGVDPGGALVTSPAR